MEQIGEFAALMYYLRNRILWGHNNCQLSFLSKVEKDEQRLLSAHVFRNKDHTVHVIYAIKQHVGLQNVQSLQRILSDNAETTPAWWVVSGACLGRALQSNDGLQRQIRNVKGFQN